MITRRDLIKGAAAGAAAGALLGHRSVALGQGGRTLTVNIVANTLGIHVPYMGALNEILASMPGYGPPKVERVSKLETITQSVLTGSVEVGTSDAISTLRAVEAGADLKIIGNCFMNTSLVFVANAERIKDFKDLERSDVTVAVNSPGDFTHVMLIQPLKKRGIDIKKVNVITTGGSGTRLRALAAGKVDAVPIHFDQAEELVKTGKFKVLIEPWKEYPNFLGEVWMVSAAWLAKPDNQRAAVDLLKATIQSFRRAHSDPAWFATAYRKYGTQSEMTKAPEAEIEAVRVKLTKEIDAFPTDMRHKVEIYQELMPVYREAGAVQGSVDPAKVVETRYAEQALKELGAA